MIKRQAKRSALDLDAQINLVKSNTLPLEEVLPPSKSRQGLSVKPNEPEGRSKFGLIEKDYMKQGRIEDKLMQKYIKEKMGGSSNQQLKSKGKAFLSIKDQVQQILATQLHRIQKRYQQPNWLTVSLVQHAPLNKLAEELHQKVDEQRNKFLQSLVANDMQKINLTRGQIKLLMHQKRKFQEKLTSNSGRNTRIREVQKQLFKEAIEQN